LNNFHFQILAVDPTDKTLNRIAHTMHMRYMYKECGSYYLNVSFGPTNIFSGGKINILGVGVEVNS